MTWCSDPTCPPGPWLLVAALLSLLLHPGVHQQRVPEAGALNPTKRLVRGLVWLIRWYRMPACCICALNMESCAVPADLPGASTLSIQQLQVFREAFDKFDQDRDNSITRAELSRALQHTGAYALLLLQL